MHLFTSGHKFNLRERLLDINPVIIKKGSWIGKNFVILPGVVVGELSIIGANSVVTRNVLDRCIAASLPEKNIKT